MTQLHSVTAESKLCGKCGVVKAFDDFYNSKRYKTGKASYCKDCHSDYYKTRCPEKRRLEAVKSRYGLSPEDYYQLKASANSTCQTCGELEGNSKPTKLVVDHCHETGIVRGMICDRCNRALGLVGDNIKTLSNLISYLSKNESLSKTTKSKA